MKVRGKLAIICMAMALVLCACGGLFTTEEEKGAHAYCDDMMRSLQEGSWETLLSMLPMGELFGSVPNVDEGSGEILSAMLSRMSYTIDAVEKQEDGHLLVSMTITNVDVKQLLLNLPEGIGSVEEAAQAMLAALDDAEQKEFAVQLTLAPVGSGEDARYELAMDAEEMTGLANALTGGLYDLAVEVLTGGDPS